MSAAPARSPQSRAGIAAVALVLVQACAAAPPLPPPAPVAPAAVRPEDLARVAALRAGVRELLAAQAELLWRAFTEGAPAELGATYAAHEGLFAPDGLAAVRRVAEATTEPDEALALGYLRSYLATEQLGLAVAAEARRAAELQAAAKLQADGRSRPLAQLPALLAAEPDAGRRAALQAAAVPAIREIAAALAEKERAAEVASRALGYAGQAELGAGLRRASLDREVELARQLLDSTEELHHAALGEAVRRELSLELSALRAADLPRLLRGPGFEARFPAGKALPAMEQTLTALGLPLAGPPPVTVRQLPVGGPAFPLCLPVALPGDVRLALPPASAPGTTSLWGALLHEAAIAVQSAHVTTEVLEFQQLGDAAVPQAFAQLFAALAEDPAWLREQTGLPAAELGAYLAGAGTRRLLRLRRQAALLLFEVAWRRGQLGTEAPALAYQRLLQRAYGFPVGPEDSERWQLDVEDLLAPVGSLRAASLAAMLDLRLREHHGERWWTVPAAGEELRALWADGRKEDGERLARRLGFDGVGPGELVADLSRALRRLPAAAPAPAAPAPAAPAPAAAPAPVPP